MTDRDRGTVQIWLGLTFLIIGIYGLYSGEILGFSKFRPAVVTLATSPLSYTISEAVYLGYGVVIVRLGRRTKRGYSDKPRS